MLGAGLDIGIQIASNLIKGEKWYSIDEKSVIISAGSGAIGAGLVSKIKKTKALIEVMVDASVSGMESAAKQYVSKGTITFEETAFDVVIGTIASGVSQDVKYITRESTRGQYDLKVMGRQLDRLERIAGDNPRPSRQANVEQMNTRVVDYGNKEKQTGKGLTTAILTIMEHIYEEDNSKD